MQRTPYFVIAIDKHLKTLKPTVADSTVVHFFDNAADIPHGGSAGNWQLATGNWQLATGNEKTPMAKQCLSTQMAIVV